MSDNIIKVLLIEENPEEARLIQETLAEATSAKFELTHVKLIGEGLKQLSEEVYDTTLLDFSQPGSQNLDTLGKVQAQAPEVPVVVLTGLKDEKLGMKAVQEGAQDYLVKGGIDANLLVRSIRYAIERHRLQAVLRTLSLVDGLTGLYNRRGFLALSRQLFNLIKRTKGRMFLMLIDLDNMKSINDTHGRNEGGRALIEIGNILKKTFRDSDIIARLDENEFVVLALEAGEQGAQILNTRLQENVEALNLKGDVEYNLAISVVIEFYDSEHHNSISELLGQTEALVNKGKPSEKESSLLKDGQELILNRAETEKAVREPNKVLVVEEDKNMAMSLHTLLEVWGYYVELVESGTKAISMAQSETPDLIIMAIELPVLNGIDVARMLRRSSLTSDIPILFVGEEIHKSKILNDKRMVKVDFIQKSFDQESLRDKVVKMLESQ